MKFLMRLFMIGAVLCLASAPVMARDVQDLTKNGPCRSDIQQFCKKVRSGNGRILRCMKQYDTYLSDACRDHIAEVKEKTRKFANVCTKDARKFCSGIKAGEGRIIDCLKEHRSDLSARCADYVR